MKPDRAVIAESVATACTESAGTVQALAEEVGVSYAALCSWSRGRRRPPPHRLVKLAEVLDVRAERLRALADELRQQAGEAPLRATPTAATDGAPDARTEQSTGRAPSGPASDLPLAAAPSREGGDDSGRGSRSWTEPAGRHRAQATRPGGIPLPIPPSR